jgi:hypothetical protein
MTVADPDRYGICLLYHDPISFGHVQSRVTMSDRPSSHIIHYDTQLFVMINGRFRETVDGVTSQAGIIAGIPGEISGFRRGTVEIFPVLECYAVHVCAWLPTFRYNMEVPKRRLPATNLRCVTLQKSEDLAHFLSKLQNE